jgi:hypothetical protein
MLNFAASNIKFGYPVRFREEQDFIDTTPIIKEPHAGSFICNISLRMK